ncbi:hypothetical protein ACH41H_21120 [Streptomyces sp. NPDC020800]|uniref:hypothetical protein n=1 Tax=Streptomyces sp. NPDC020800 TaxID=3365092 RepID=UPI00378F01F7
MADKVKNYLAGIGVNRLFGTSLGMWVFYNFFISSLPIPIAYATLVQGGSLDSLGERGDFFVITAALIAGEMPGLAKVNKAREGHVGDLITAAMFGVVATCLLSFAVASANFSAAQHAKSSASGKDTPEPPPFPWFEESFTIKASVVLYSAGVALVIISMAWRAKGSGGKVE